MKKFNKFKKEIKIPGELAMIVTGIIFNREPGWSIKLDKAIEKYIKTLITAMSDEMEKKKCSCGLMCAYNLAIKDFKSIADKYLKKI